MDPILIPLLKELEQYGAQNDERISNHSKKMLNITPDTGAFLSLLIQATRSRRILEIGTSNGYSTLWLADAARQVNGRVTTIEVLPEKAEMARSNFSRAGLTPWIEPILGNAGDLLATDPAESFEFVFLDSNRGEYVGWWPNLQRVIISGGLLVIDNAISHAAEMAEMTRKIESTAGCVTSLVPVGKGELMVLKQRR
jgi:predicted O-methyltransferase YrrM